MALITPPNPSEASSVAPAISRLIRYPQIPADWDQRFLYVAASAASWSKDPSTRVGAVAVRNRRILATGYNGFPAGVNDSIHRLSNRQIRLAMTVHAEKNLVCDAASRGACLAGSTVYVYPLMTCGPCAGALIQAQVARVVIPDFVEPQRWKDDFDVAREMFGEAGVCVERIPLEGPLANPRIEPGAIADDFEDSLLHLH